MRRTLFWFAILALATPLLARVVASDPPDVILPAGGTVDDRPFFGTRRQPAVSCLSLTPSTTARRSMSSPT
jgi:hypothetical protein